MPLLYSNFLIRHEMTRKVAVQVTMLLAGRYKSLLGLLPMLLCGCALVGGDISPVVKEDANNAILRSKPLLEKSKLAARNKMMNTFLMNAKLAMMDNRLMKPHNDNAYDWYNQVLSIDSRQPEAHRGMREIGRRYLDLAEQAYEAGDRGRAELLLDRALSVSASAKDVQLVKSRYPKPKSLANEFLLSANGVSQRSTQVKEQLKALAERARQLPSRIVIIARNDNEGRWIYKQMRLSVQGYRLRGNIQIGREPKIVLIDMPNKVLEVSVM